jgi:hypothetical protein
MDLSIGESGSAVKGTAKSTIRCGLCRETIELVSNFRPTPTVCPHCGLKFTFDPQKQPLPVSGMRLNWSAVAAARDGAARQPLDATRHHLHQAHASKQLVAPPQRTNFLAWAGSLALGLAGLLTLLSWLRR